MNETFQGCLLIAAIGIIVIAMFMRSGGGRR